MMGMRELECNTHKIHICGNTSLQPPDGAQNIPFVGFLVLLSHYGRCHNEMKTLRLSHIEITVILCFKPVKILFSNFEFLQIQSSNFVPLDRCAVPSQDM